MTITNPDLPPGEQPKLSPLAQTFQAIGHTSFKLGAAHRMELNYALWSAAANLTTREFATMRRLKRDWLSGAKWG